MDGDNRPGRHRQTGRRTGADKKGNLIRMMDVKKRLQKGVHAIHERRVHERFILICPNFGGIFPSFFSEDVLKSQKDCRPAPVPVYQLSVAQFMFQKCWTCVLELFREMPVCLWECVCTCVRPTLAVSASTFVLGLCFVSNSHWLRGQMSLIVADPFLGQVDRTCLPGWLQWFNLTWNQLATTWNRQPICN